jgi:hypothetical protein
MARGNECLTRLNDRIESRCGYFTERGTISDHDRTPLEILHDEILDSHDDVRHWPYHEFHAAIGADIRESTGFTQWAETQRLLGDLLPPLSRVEPDHVADEYFQMVHGAPARVSANPPSPERAAHRRGQAFLTKTCD